MDFWLSVQSLRFYYVKWDSPTQIRTSGNIGLISVENGALTGMPVLVVHSQQSAVWNDLDEPQVDKREAGSLGSTAREYAKYDDRKISQSKRRIKDKVVGGYADLPQQAANSSAQSTTLHCVRQPARHHRIRSKSQGKQDQMTDDNNELDADINAYSRNFPINIRETSSSQRGVSKTQSRLDEMTSVRRKNETVMTQGKNSSSGRNLYQKRDRSYIRVHQTDLNANHQNEVVGFGLSSETNRNTKRSYKSKCNNEVSKEQINAPCRNLKLVTTIRKPISFIKLRDIVLKEPSEILLTLCHCESGFQQLLEKENIPRNFMAVILTALGKACQAELQCNLKSFINMVSSKKMFVYFNMQSYLISFQTNKNKKMHLDSLCYLIEFLSYFQQCQPATSSETLSIILPLLRIVCTTVFTSPQDGDKLEKLDELEKEKNNFIEHHTEKQQKIISYNERKQLENPPEDFRLISILPNENDICNREPFLRPNIVEGKYFNTEHYLDVQFRLLREDYVEPLRDGITKYLKSKNSENKTNLKDVRVYENVHILQSDFIDGGLVHITRFDIKSFNNVRWESSKRFLTGSLLCLSSDDFKSMLFASVAKRDLSRLKDGLLILKFEELTDEVLNISPLRTFVMVETFAYFEAYRHNLAALQCLTEDNLPLKKYIVDVEDDVISPQYLKDCTTYDMRPLFFPLDESLPIKQISDLDKNCVVEYDFPSNLQHVKAVPIRNDNCWPTERDLGLDISQYNALKAAITKEFAVIQGPPGTGKTYIGLRLVQLLLHNKQKWNATNVQGVHSPILVVCYTNHALDSFLEGILLFSKNVIRIGGRCAEEKLLPYQLSELRKKIRINREIPDHIFKNTREKRWVLRDLQDDIKEMEMSIAASIKSILSEELLKKYISPLHYDMLKRSILSHSTDDSYSICVWLGVRSRWLEEDSNDVENVNFIINSTSVTTNSISDNDSEIVTKNQNSFGFINSIAAFGKRTLEALGRHISVSHTDSAASASVNGESEEEADIEYIEAMREIDNEEFSDIAFNIKDGRSKVNHLLLNEMFHIEESKWETQGGSKKLKQYILKQLRQDDIMPPDEVAKVCNIWVIPSQDRWRLYRYWRECYIAEKQQEVVETHRKIREEFQELRELRFEEDLHALRKADVVAMTTTGAAKYRTILQSLNPRIIIVEEAAEVLEAHVVTALAQGTQHLVLIGDHQQLRPNPVVYRLAKRYNLDISLFERMVRNGMQLHKLTLQHRMRPSIAALLVPHIYSSLENHISVQHYENIKGVSKNIYFLNHSFNEASEIDSKSHVNHYEAYFLVEFCRYLLLQGYKASQITILTTYSGQMFVLRKLTKNDIFKGVRITVVDNFQGEENDIILISFVRSNEDGNIGFLKVANRVCVALSRAKMGLYCTGNFELMAQKSDLWKNIISILNKQSAIGPAVLLTCQNHPEIGTEVTSGDDFSKVPEGGCIRPCEYRLECGHTCARMCHPYDLTHELFKCMKNCTKFVCKYNHKCCKKCYEKCGTCTKLVDKLIPGCQHTVAVPCHQDPKTFICTGVCQRVLPCGHMCPKLCGVKCETTCRKLVTVASTCGHNVELKCCNKDSIETVLSQCKNPCKTELDCGHLCKGNCALCHQGRIHQACDEPCKRILVCGHECKSPCAKSCPPCRLPCENRCSHSKCPLKCGNPCSPCKEKCQWQCIHHKCKKLCSEPCDRPPCDFPCPNKLPECGHQCIGLCGEPCPEKCAFCNPEVKEIFFGTEDEENARFIQLEDCHHIFEIDGISQWMISNANGTGEIQMKACPRCKTIIRKNLRFGNVIKSCLADIEKVKAIVFGEKKKIKQKQRDLLKVAQQNLDMHPTFGNIYIPVIDILQNRKSINNQDIIRSENIINIATEFAATMSNLTPCFSTRDLYHIIGNSSRSSPEFSNENKSLSSFIDQTVELIVKFFTVSFQTATSQQLNDVSCELHRLKLLGKLSSFAKTFDGGVKLTPERKQTYLESIQCLTKHSRFQEGEEVHFNKVFTKLVSGTGTVLNITIEERKNILSAMNLAQGHWYQCPNGHVYCITECGGAMVESKCNECGAKIGGRHHSLLRDNRVATEMDGARHSAWSEAANMLNYEQVF